MNLHLNSIWLDDATFLTLHTSSCDQAHYIQAESRGEAFVKKKTKILGLNI